jgi:hypothetical protein
MPEQVQEDGIRSIAGKNMPVTGFFFGNAVENMTEQVFAQRFQKIIFGFKMGVEGRSADIGAADDLTDGDLCEMLFGKKVNEGAEDGFAGFSLASVHN